MNHINDKTYDAKLKFKRRQIDVIFCFFFFPKKGFDISCKLGERLHEMLSLFSGENEKNI